MKNIINRQNGAFRMIVTIILLLLLNSSKEAQAPLKIKSITSYTDNIDYSAITYYGGVLVFSNETKIMETINKLSTQYDEHDEWFLDQYDTLSVDSLNEIELIIGHNSNLPYENFQDSFVGFNSLWKVINDDEEYWLANSDTLIIDSDPDNHFIQEDELRCVLNEEAEVATQNKVIKFYDGYYLEIYGGGLDTLLACRDSLNLGSINPDSLTDGLNSHQTLGITIVIFKIGGGGSSAPGCNPQTLKRDAGFKSNGSNRKIKWSLWIENIQLTNGNVHSKTKNYRKKSNGKWEKYRDNVFAKCFGIMTIPIDCDEHEFECETQTKKKRKIQVKGCVVGLTKANSGDVEGVHTGAGGASYDSKLLF